MTYITLSKQRDLKPDTLPRLDRSAASILRPPGRLDVFQYPFLGRDNPHVRTFDLRASSIVLANSTAYISPDGLETFAIGGFSTVESREALLAAAISTAPTPPLPENELTG